MKNDSLEKLKKLLIVTFAAILYACALNFFLTPANLFTGGIAGVSQLITGIAERYFDIHISTGLLLLVFIVPIIYLAWKEIGKSFTFFSGYSVLVMSLALEFVPILSVSEDILLNSIFGGVLAGLAIGVTLRYGASTGGLDIIALVASFHKGKSVGSYLFMINVVIVLFAGIFFEWERALYTMISLYASMRVVDFVHTAQVKLTAFVITKNVEAVREAIFSRMVRGATLLPAEGGYTHEQKGVLMIVLTRYELYELNRTLKEVDPSAFTNIVETVDIQGNFKRKYMTS